MKRVQGQHSQSTIVILEEAVHLLRQAPIALLPSYYIGSLPFILGLLYFWGDMSRSADASAYSAVASLGIALLFLWMKCWQSIFTMRVKMYVNGQPDSGWTMPRILSLVAMQTLIHSTALFVLPLSALMVLPFGWCYAFYQNATVHGDQKIKDVRSICKSAWLQAKLWPKQNHILLSVFFVFGFIVFLNIAIAIFVVPHLLKKFFGIKSLFTLSGFNVINTTFWAATIGITYLCMDPLVKTVYVLRCFYGAALKSGEDLKSEMNQFLQNRHRLIAGTLIAILFITPMKSLASQPLLISPEVLDRSIEEVMERREFTWRMPRETSQKEDHKLKGPLASVMIWIDKMLEKGLNTLKGWIDKLIEWLIKLWPTADPRIPSSDKDWIASVRLIIILLLTGLVCALIYILIRTWIRRRASQVEIPATAIESVPDLEDDDITADQLSVDHWLVLAKELAEKGTFRLALRALYLATLANLAEHEMLTIEGYKSNQEYELELQRRAHAKKDLLSAFSKSKNIFERVWYGMYRINRPDLENYAAIQKRIMAFAES